MSSSQRRWSALLTASTVVRIVAWLVALVGAVVLARIVMLITGNPMSTGPMHGGTIRSDIGAAVMAGSTLGFILLFILLAAGAELILLLISIEENTRNSAQSAVATTGNTGRTRALWDLFARWALKPVWGLAVIVLPAVLLLAIVGLRGKMGPHASFIVGGVENDCINILDSSQSSGVDRVHWDFGDATDAQDAYLPTSHHCYGSPGTYTITLAVTGLFGWTDVTTRHVSLH